MQAHLASYATLAPAWDTCSAFTSFDPEGAMQAPSLNPNYANPATTWDTNWYPDSGATNHVTPLG
ncbi:hypothetical protein Dimus_013078 [Dionaea muscipula]